jgi:hypothetical protein
MRRRRRPGNPFGNLLGGAMGSGLAAEPLIRRAFARPGSGAPEWLTLAPVGQILMNVASRDKLSSEKSHARKTEFVEPFQPDLGRPVLKQKIIRFVITPNQWFPVVVPARSEQLCWK